MAAATAVPAGLPTAAPAPLVDVWRPVDVAVAAFPLAEEAGLAPVRAIDHALLTDQLRPRLAWAAIMGGLGIRLRCQDIGSVVSPKSSRLLSLRLS